MSRADRERHLKDALAKIMAGATSTPTLETLTLDLVTQWGGSGAFAKEYKKQYDGATSSMVKAKMLGDVIYLIKLTSANKRPADLGEFSDDDLRSVAAAALQQLADENVEIQNAPEEEAKATGGGGEPAP